MEDQFVLTRTVVVWLGVVAVAALGLRNTNDFAPPLLFILGISLFLFAVLNTKVQRIRSLAQGITGRDLSQRDGFIGLAGVVLMVAAWI